MIFWWTLGHLERHLALACAANAASSRHLAFFARFQLVKDSCRSTACKQTNESSVILWQEFVF